MGVVHAAAPHTRAHKADTRRRASFLTIRASVEACGRVWVNIARTQGRMARAHSAAGAASEMRLAHSQSSDSADGNIHQLLSAASWMQVVKADGWLSTTPPAVNWKRT
jgi:hypothetical protein